MSDKSSFENAELRIFRIKDALKIKNEHILRIFIEYKELLWMNEFILNERFKQHAFNKQILIQKRRKNMTCAVSKAGLAGSEIFSEDRWDLFDEIFSSEIRWSWDTKNYKKKDSLINQCLK